MLYCIWTLPPPKKKQNQKPLMLLLPEIYFGFIFSPWTNPQAPDDQLTNQQECWNERNEHNENSFYCRKKLSQQNVEEKTSISGGKTHSHKRCLYCVFAI